MTTLHAQPYDICASGFYFDTFEQYEAKYAKNRNEYGQPVEEYEIQFIDGDSLDAALGRHVDQCNLAKYLEAMDSWDDDQKLKAAIAFDNNIASVDFDIDPNDLYIDVYQDMDMRELAEQFVDDGLFGEIPNSLQYYIDYDAIARDLAVDYTTYNIAGHSGVYRAG